MNDYPEEVDTFPACVPDGSLLRVDCPASVTSGTPVATFQRIFPMAAREPTKQDQEYHPP